MGLRSLFTLFASDAHGREEGRGGEAGEGHTNSIEISEFGIVLGSVGDFLRRALSPDGRGGRDRAALTWADEIPGW